MFYFFIYSYEILFKIDKSVLNIQLNIKNRLNLGGLFYRQSIKNDVQINRGYLPLEA